MNLINKLSFSDILKSNSTFKPGKIKENKEELKQFIIDTRKEQDAILRLKHLNDAQLKVIIKL